MESKIEYRDAAGRDIKLPKEVYHRCEWLVRDSGRLKELALVLDADNSTGGSLYDSDICTSEAGAGGYILVSEDVAARAAAELACIESALTKIPEVYREGIFDNITEKKPFDDFAHPNTWKRWKLVFLYELAKELRLI